MLLVEKMLSENNFLNGKSPGLPDYIFFGNFMWAENVAMRLSSIKNHLSLSGLKKIKCLNNL